MNLDLFNIIIFAANQKDLKLKITKLVSWQRFRFSKPAQFEMFWDEMVLNGTNFASDIKNPAISLHLKFVVRYGIKMHFRALWNIRFEKNIAFG